MAGTKKENNEAQLSETAKDVSVRTDAKEIAPAQKKVSEPVYTVQELLGVSEKLFNVKRECAYAALKPLKVEKMTVKEAVTAVEKFMKKEVK